MITFDFLSGRKVGNDSQAAESVIGYHRYRHKSKTPKMAFLI